MAYENPNPDSFNRVVWEIVRQIPRGEVATFGQIASMIPAPPDYDAAAYQKLAPRWVGDAMNAVSRVDEPTVPWHRVINARGAISLPEDSPSARTQHQRLLAEGHRFDAQGRVDLGSVAWEGPPTEWLAVNGLLAPKSLRRPADDGGQLRLF